jgi:hypothetical protein
MITQVVGGLVRFGDYIAWAKAKGVVVSYSTTPDPNGGAPFRVVKLFSNHGYAEDVGTEDDDYLPRGRIAYFNRRLGLTGSPPVFGGGPPVAGP